MASSPAPESPGEPEVRPATACALCGYPDDTSAQLAPDCGCAAHPLCANCLRAAQLSHARAAGPAPQFCPFGACEALLPPLPAAPAPPARARLGCLVPATPAEAEEVTRVFTKSLGRAPKHVKVHKVVNPALEAVYLQCQERFRRCGSTKELEVYHGTTRAASGSIVKNGFDASFSGKANGQVHGRGIYVSPSAQFSEGYTKGDISGGRRMFICTALPGVNNYTPATKNIYVFPRDMQVLPRWVVDYD